MCAGRPDASTPHSITEGAVLLELAGSNDRIKKQISQGVCFLVVVPASSNSYEWKGTIQRHGSHVRPSGEGCGYAENNEAEE